jgi:glutamate synthase (NADPH/NADH) large chain
VHTIKTQTILSSSVLDCTFADDEDLYDVIGRLQSGAEEEVRAGVAILVLSDAAVTTNRLPVPMALAVGAVHHHLIRCGLRMRADIVAESGDCWDVHHLAVLVGYGAAGVCPWLALRSCVGEEEKLLEVFNLGLRKVMSKLGISDVSSYRGGQFFEILGLDNSVIEDCFAGTPALTGGVGYQAIMRESLRRAALLNNGQQRQELPDFGSIRYRSDKNSDQHAWQPPVVRALQHAVGSSRAQVPADKQGQSWTDFNVLSSDLEPHNLRDLLSVRFVDNPINVDEVEPASQIARRFVASAMSLGSISPEAHRTLSIAMNRLGGRSNTGEGGEDPEVYDQQSDAENKIKQVASGRFGVTAEYLARAEELEIKIAQGAKPGEGGQLPGAKVTDLIARLRHAQPGMSLISPPPHHDIYSIEDIAQLIHDLKEVNPQARVGVKLVSQSGIGTVASGVAKAYADYILVSGHAGGTGAAPLTGIKHAGTPWELGLAETQQTLVRNGVRGRVSLRVDGGLRTARDIVIAALLGAEEFGFGTATLVALGCDMARQCHLNTCPTGIATQKPELRAKFRGTPEQVIAYFTKLAEDVRALLARLGLRSVEEAVGRVDLLEQSRWDGGLDLSKLLYREPGSAIRREHPRNDPPHRESVFGPAFTRRIVDAVANGAAYESDFAVRNSDRSIGAAISGELVRTFAKRQHGHVHLNLTGSAGQSFGAFCTTGVHLLLEGEANDYVGKGLSGGVLVLRPRGQARLAPNHNVILGNVALYGATAGRLFAAGCAGERFAVRNSGAIAVVEGIGDHGCEYMTGGCVAVLGPTGANFGAGMTGGVAYLFDPDDRVANKVNGECVSVCRVNDAQLHRLWTLISVHAAFTGSLWAREILANWHSHRQSFCAVLPVGVAAPETAPAFIYGAQNADTGVVPVVA